MRNKYTQLLHRPGVSKHSCTTARLNGGAHLRLNPVEQRIDVLRRSQPHRLLHLQAVRPQVLVLRCTQTPSDSWGVEESRDSACSGVTPATACNVYHVRCDASTHSVSQMEVATTEYILNNRTWYLGHMLKPSGHASLKDNQVNLILRKSLRSRAPPVCAPSGRRT